MWKRIPDCVPSSKVMWEESGSATIVAVSASAAAIRPLLLFAIRTLEVDPALLCFQLGHVDSRNLG